MRCFRDETDCGAVMLIRTRSKAVVEQGNVSDGKSLKDSGGEGLVEFGGRDFEDSTVNGTGVSTLSDKLIGMDNWDSDSSVAKHIDSSKADTGVAEGHVDNSGLDSMGESGKGDDSESDSGETGKDGARGIQTVNLEA